MPALAEREEDVAVAAATDAIHAQRSQLQAEFDAKTLELEARIAEAESIERNHRKLMRAANLAADRVGELSQEIKAAMPAAVLRIIDGTDSGALDFKPLALVEPAVAERQRVLLFIEEMAFYLQESNEMREVAKAAQIFAEADQVEALAEQRAFDTRIALIPIADAEGELIIDEARTVSGALKRRAAELRITAGGVRERLQEMQKQRKAN